MSGEKILIVDDEASIREPLADYLAGHHYDILRAKDGLEAREVCRTAQPDLVLLDIMMPGEDGLSLLREWQATGGPPVILLTAMADDTDRIVGLELGADDYVTKPFNPRELVARIKAVLRRAGGEGANPPPDACEGYSFAGFHLDIGRRHLTGPDHPSIPLTGGEFALLHVLLDSAGRVLSRDQLLDATQGREAHLFDRSIDNQISRIRKKIELDPKQPQIIKTVRNGGYVLSVPVSRR